MYMHACIGLFGRKKKVFTCGKKQNHQVEDKLLDRVHN